MLSLEKVLPALTPVTLYQKRYIRKVTTTYIKCMGQNKHDTERHMLKTSEHMNQMEFAKQDEFAKQPFHERYFLAYEEKGMFMGGSLFFTMLGITSCMAGLLKGVGFW